MDTAKNLQDLFPDWVSEEALQRVFSHYDKGAFTFPLMDSEICSSNRNTVYHIIPHYAATGAEDIIHKLRRIMANELPK